MGWILQKQLYSFLNLKLDAGGQNHTPVDLNSQSDNAPIK